jgi:hypothetical protein
VKASGLKWPGLSLEGAVIFQDMQREISQSDIVIAEITLANPNVFYAAANFRSILRAIGLSFTTTASVASRASKRIWRGTWTRSANLPANALPFDVQPEGGAGARTTDADGNHGARPVPAEEWIDNP